MDFSSWETWALMAIGAVLILGLVGTIFAKKDTAAASPEPAERANILLGAINTHAARFDRDMYIDDMSADQLEYEHVWRTAFITGYNIVWSLGPQKDNPFEKVCTAITGHPADPQLTGLTHYYFDTVYELMMAAGEDRYWDDELIALKDQWTDERREQILLAALIPLQMANELHISIRNGPLADADTALAALVGHVDRVGDAFFGPSAPERMADLRAQAAAMAGQIAL